jgi:hypothetical protein
MWFYPILLMLVVLGIAGGIFMGGVYTLVLVPLVVIAVVSVVGYAMWARSQSAAGAGADADPSPGPPLPHQRRREPAHVSAQPERLVDARRQQQ